MKQALFAAILAYTVVCAVPSSAPGCSVPVFRYALERWGPDLYELVVFHEAPLDAATSNALRSVSRSDANIRCVTTLTGTNMTAASRALLEQAKPPRLPWLVLRYPAGYREQSEVDVAWSGAYEAGILQAILYSPARQETARRLLGGESAVWILIECGNDDKDAAAADLLMTRFAFIEQALALPEESEEDSAARQAELIRNGYGFQAPTRLDIPLKIDFSLLRVSRAAPAERILLSMLLGAEPDLAQYGDEPIVFPIFGQGRALLPLIGKGIVDDQIDQTCGFLTSPCSCEIKGMNPGMDTLMSVDWSGSVTNVYTADDQPPVLTAVLPDPPSGEQDSDAAVAEPDAAPVKIVPAAPPSRTLLVLALAVTALFVLLIGGIVATSMMLRRKES